MRRTVIGDIGHTSKQSTKWRTQSRSQNLPLLVGSASVSLNLRHEQCVQNLTRTLGRPRVGVGVGVRVVLCSTFKVRVRVKVDPGSTRGQSHNILYLI
jgi:hypothetical protein